MKNRPVRTCLGCHQRFLKKQLLKFVLEEGAVVLDRKGTKQGRSAYCCRSTGCLQIFFGNKKKLSRAFRVQDCQVSQVSVALEDENTE